MAAHALTIINQTLHEGREITEKVCEQIEHGCMYARGLDLPSLTMADADLVYAAAKTRIPAMMQAALENVIPRVAYQKAYFNVEHLLRARDLFLDVPKDGWIERSRAFAELPQPQHELLARVATEAERALAKS